MSTTYTVERLDGISIHNDDVASYIIEEIPKLAARFQDKLNYKNADVYSIVDDCYFMICRRDDEITGHMILDLYDHVFDPDIKVLYQISLYAKPGSGRTAWHLFQKFIDIGRSQANHVITMISPQTNIKSSTLEKMGFVEMETLYRLEIP